MAWSLREDEEKNLFLYINGERALNPETAENFKMIKTVQNGRNKDEIWMNFEGARSGRRLLRCSLQEIGNVKRCDSNAQFISMLTSNFNVSCGDGKKKKAKVQAPNRPTSLELEPPINIIPEETHQDTEILSVESKRIGEFKVDIEKLFESPEDLSCRELVRPWVENIKKSIKNAPGTPVTIFPVLVDPEKINDPENFQVHMLESMRLILLGGNHAVKAFKEILSEEAQNEIFKNYRKVTIEVYVGLTTEEAKLIGILHNKRTVTLTLNFQSKVKLARSIFAQNNDDWKEVVLKILRENGSNKSTKDSLGTLWSVSSYDNALFSEVERLFQHYNDEKPGKDFPQILFKTLQGLSNPSKLDYLKKTNISNIKEIIREVNDKKKLENMKKIFMEITATSEEEAERRFPEELLSLESFKDLDFSHGRIPTTFKSFCEEARNSSGASAQDFAIDVEITVNCCGENVDDSEDLDIILEKHRKRIKLDVQNYINKKKCAADEE